MHQFQKEAADITSANIFGLEYQHLLLKYFCKVEEFIAKYEENDTWYSEHEDGEYSDDNLHCKSTTDITIEKQPQVMEEIQDKNREDELLTEAKVY